MMRVPAPASEATDVSPSGTPCRRLTWVQPTVTLGAAAVLDGGKLGLYSAIGDSRFGAECREKPVHKADCQIQKTAVIVGE